MFDIAAISLKGRREIDITDSFNNKKSVKLLNYNKKNILLI